jgi:hypothetical protein
MSSDTCIAYFGLRFDVEADEVEGIEERSDARVVAARKEGLKYYWGNFAGLDERYLLFIGTQIGVLGEENSNEIILTANDMQQLFDTTSVKLKAAGFSDTPAFHLNWQPDV